MAATDQMIDPLPNLAAAIDFLQRWMPGGPWVLTAINPRDKGIQTLAFVDPDRLRDTLAHWSAKRWGIYFQVNPDRRDPAAHPLQGSKDRYRRGALAALRSRHLQGRAFPGDGDGQAAACCARSAHRCHIEWAWRAGVLASPAAGGPGRHRARGGSRNAWLARELGGDSTFDVSRIMRLPGCINWPNRAQAGDGPRAGAGEAHLVGRQVGL